MSRLILATIAVLGGRFWRAQHGNVAMIWAIVAAALISLVGVTVDFTRAQTLRSQMQNAVDGAALVAQRSIDLGESQQLAAARAYFDQTLGDAPVVGAIDFDVTPVDGGAVRVTASAAFDHGMSLVTRYFGSSGTWRVNVTSEAIQSGENLEVAMVLDITGSMAGQRIIDLRAAAADAADILIRDEQEPYYSKVALIPYSQSVNVGAAYAAQVRGPIAAARDITDMSWANGTAKSITGATRANPVEVTAVNHGFTTGDAVFIRAVNGMTNINNRVFRVGPTTTDSFQLLNPDGSNVNGSGYNNYSSGGTAQRCTLPSCEITVTSNNHGFAANDHIFISGVSGMGKVSSPPPPSGTPDINNAANTTWRVGSVTQNTFTLLGSIGGFYNPYSSGGSAYCTLEGCEYFRFSNPSGSIRVHRVTTCVTERGGAHRYSDDPVRDEFSYVGRNYPPSSENCPSHSIIPLTSDQDTLINRINALTTNGFTAGHIGIEWGWYMLSPNFASLWPSDNQPVDYDEPETLKIAIIMTDGAFNTAYCRGVISADSSSGGSDRINCNAQDDSFGQAAELCSAMKRQGIIIYTVGFGVGGDASARNWVNTCASPGKGYLAANGAQLREIFRQIATNITRLRISH